jgi:hypothetical protein
MERHKESFRWLPRLPFVLAACRPGEGKAGIAQIAYTRGSIILGIAMARLVEFLILRIRDRLIPSMSRAIDIASAKERHAVDGVDGGEASSVIAT